MFIDDPIDDKIIKQAADRVTRSLEDTLIASMKSSFKHGVRITGA